MSHVAIMRQLDPDELQQSENLLREHVQECLDADSGEAGANDDRWKARQSRQLGTIGHDVHQLAARVSGLDTLEGLSLKTLDHLDRMAHEQQHRADELAEQRRLLEQLGTRLDAQEQRGGGMLSIRAKASTKPKGATDEVRA